MGKNGKPNNRVDVGGNVTNSNITINNYGKEKGSDKNKNPKNKNDILQWVVISIIGLILISVVFSSIDLPLSGTAGTPTETFTLIPSVAATNTLLPNEPTLTPIPPTDTPTLTPSPIPPVSLGEDWTQGCISTIWSAYPEAIIPEERGDGCWREPIHAFSAENGDLDFLYERADGDEEIYGLFAPLPNESGSVTLTIRLRDLSNADLLIGIFAQPEVQSQGLLMMMLNGGVKDNVFIQKDPMTYETILGSQKIYQGNGYSITFHFNDLSVRSVVNPSVFFVDPFSLPSSQKYLFLGYKGLRGYYRIEGTFLNFELKE